MKKLKHLITAAALLGALAVVPTACGEEEKKPVDSTPPASSLPGEDSSSIPETVIVSVSESTLSLKTGESKLVIASVMGTEETPVWTSSNPEVATVADGTITAVAEGTATITVSVAGEAATVEVTVADDVAFVIADANFALNTATYEHPENGTLGEVSKQISYEFTVNGAAVTDATVTYSSANDKIASVDENGVVTAKKDGKTIITASVTHNGKTYEQTVNVNVTKLVVHSGVRYTFGGDKAAWVIDVSRLGFTPVDVYAIYRADGEDFVQVDENYEIIYDGNCAKVITDGIDIDTKTEPDLVIVETDDLKYEIDVVYVTQNNVEFVSEVSPMVIGATKQLKLYVFGEEVDSDDPVEWSVNKEQIATVDQTGTVTAVNYGTAVITAKVYGYTYTTTQVVYKAEAISVDNATDWSVSGVNGDANTKTTGTMVLTHGTYIPGDWVSFKFTPAADITSGMIYAYYGHNNQAEGYPNGAWWVCAGAKSYTGGNYDDHSFIILDSNGMQVGSIADEAGFGKLNANETYTIFMQIPDDGTDNHDVFVYFAEKEILLSEAQVKTGVLVWRDQLKTVMPVEITKSDFVGYVYNGETRQLVEKEDTFTFNVAELDATNTVDISAWGLTQDVVSAKIDGFKYDVFVTDDAGKPVVTDGKLTVKNDFYTFAGTSGAQTLVIETEDYKYTASIEIVPADARMNGVTHLVANAAETAIVTAQEMVDKIAAGEKYLLVDFYYYGDVDSSHMFKINFGGRHVQIMPDCILIQSLNHQGGWQWDYENINENFAKVLDENGQLVNNKIRNANASGLYGDVVGTMEKGKWYTLVIDMTQKYGTDSDCIAQKWHVNVSGIGTDVYVNNVRFDDSNVPVTLDRASATINVGAEPLTLNADLSLLSANENIVWASSNEEIATVENGVVTAVSAGTVEITATVNGYSATCVVTVQPAAGAISNVIFKVADSTVYSIETDTDAVIPAEKLPTAPTIVSYSFEGWYADGDTEAFDFANSVITGDLVLTAKYAPVWYSDTEEFKNESNMYYYRKPETLLKGSEVFAAVAANTSYYVFDLTLYEGTTSIYMQLVGRHIEISANGLNIGGKCVNENVPADMFAAYDENGVLVNNYVKLEGNAVNADTATTNALELGKTYTIILNIAGMGWTSDFLITNGFATDMASVNAWVDNNNQDFTLAAMGDSKFSITTSYDVMSKEAALEIVAPKATVTFKHGEQVISSGESLLNNLVTPPTMPELVSYNFVGWKVEGTDEAFDVATDVLTGDTTLVAVYEPTGAAGNVGDVISPYPSKSLLDGVSVLDAMEANAEAKYFAFNVTLHSALTGTDFIYMQIVGRHFIIDANGLNVFCLNGTWNSDPQNIPADTMRIFDDTGALINDFITTPAYGVLNDGAKGTMEVGKEYTIVINVASLFWTRSLLDSLGPDYQGEKGEAFIIDQKQDISVAANGNLHFSASPVTTDIMTKEVVDDLVIPSYTATFKVGNTVVATEKAKIDTALAVTEMAAPSLLSYEFAGWVYEGTDTAWDPAAIMTEDVTLVAKYNLLTEGGLSGNGYTTGTVSKYMNGLDIWTALESGNGTDYVTFNFTLHDNDGYIYFDFLARHMVMTKDGLNIFAFDGTWQTDPQNIFADTFRVFDEDGVLVNDYITSPAYGALCGTAFNALEVGKSYTLVLNLKSVYFTRATLGAIGEAFQGEKGEAYIADSYIQIGANTMMLEMTSDNVAKTNEEVLKEVGAWVEPETPEVPAEPEA